MKHQLILGIVNVVVGLALVVICIILNRTERVAFAFFPVAVGLGNIAAYISERRDHKRRMTELTKNGVLKKRKTTTKMNTDPKTKTGMMRVKQ